MAQEMGLGPMTSACFKRKFRWTMSILGVCGPEGGAKILPPSKAARPNLSFKTIDVQHLNETIYYPGKPDWKPISLTLYDLAINPNPVFEWLKKIYDPSLIKGNWNSQNVGAYKRKATLTMLDGCGETIEAWEFINSWPESIEFGDLDYGSSEYVTADITMRYDRAFTI